MKKFPTTLVLLSIIFLLLTTLASAQATPAQSPIYAVYWAGWGQQSYNLQHLPPAVNVINMAFADIRKDADR